MDLQKRLNDYTKNFAVSKMNNVTEYAIGDAEPINDVCRRIPFEIVYDCGWRGKVNISLEDFQDFTAFDYTEIFPDSVIPFDDFMFITEENDLGDYTVEDLLGSMDCDERYNKLFLNQAIDIGMYNLDNEYFGKLNIGIEIQFDEKDKFNTLEPSDQDEIIMDVCSGVYSGIYEDLYFNYMYVIDFDGYEFIGTADEIKDLMEDKEVNVFKLNVYSNPELGRAVGQILHNETLFEIADIVDDIQHFEFGYSLEDKIQDAEKQKNNQEKSDKKPGKDDLEK